jgi:hypothetical protein
VVFIVLLNIATGLKIATNTVPCFVKESGENPTIASCAHCEKHRLLAVLVAHAENTATGSVQRTGHGSVWLSHRSTYSVDNKVPSTGSSSALSISLVSSCAFNVNPDTELTGANKPVTLLMARHVAAGSKNSTANHLKNLFSAVRNHFQHTEWESR